MDGFYNSLLSFIDKAVEEGFIIPSARHIIVSAPTARELVKKLEVNKKKLFHFFMNAILVPNICFEARWSSNY